MIIISLYYFYVNNSETYKRTHHQRQRFFWKNGIFSIIKDPYVVCMIGQEKHKGNQCSGSGTSPQWSDTFVFNTKDQIMRV